MTTKQDKPISIRDVSYEHQQVVEAMKNELLIVLIGRLGGSVDIPVQEVDDFPVGRGLSLALRDGVFHFEVTEGPNVKVSGRR